MKACVMLMMLSLAGCAVLHDARETQESLREKGRDNAQVTPEPDFNPGPARAGELVDFALTNRPQRVTKALAVEDARVALKALAANAPIFSKAPWTTETPLGFADVTASGGYSASAHGAHFDHLKSRTYGNWSASLSVDLLVYDFGRYSAEAEAQAEAVVAAELSYVKSGFDAFEEVTTSLATVLENESLYEVALTNRMEYAGYLTRAQNRLEAGEGRKYDVLEAQYNLQSAEERVIAASNAVRTARANFLQALGLSATRPQGAGVLSRGGNVIEDLRPCLPETSATANELYDFARTNAPAMRVARANLRAAQADVDYARADLLPSLSASVGLDWTDPLWYWRWGANIAQTIFVGGRKMRALEHATIALKSQSSAIDEAERSLALQIEQTVAERDNAAQQFVSASASVAQALENLRIAEKQYEVGELSGIDYNTAVNSYVTSLGNRLSAFYARQRAEASLIALTGTQPKFLPSEESNEEEERENQS